MKMLYTEKGSLDVKIEVEINSQKISLSSNNTTQSFNNNFLIIEKIKSFLTSIGLTDLSGLRSENIVRIIQGQYHKEVLNHVN